jgi:Family of unknown function (DUF5947)
VVKAMSATGTGWDHGFGMLQQWARRRAAAELCELCGRAIPEAHDHLIEPATRRLVCACEPCAILFPGTETRFKRVPRGARALPGFEITRAQWDSLLMPIEMAFFFASTPAGRTVAMYPGPAGATESLLPLETWNDIAQGWPALRGMQPDVEALVVNRLAATPGRREDGRGEYFIVPIDECFRLVGLIRLHWKGLSGGTDVWREIGHFFSAIRVRATGGFEVPSA